MYSFQEKHTIYTPVEEKISNHEAASLMKQRETLNEKTEVKPQSHNIYVPGQTKRWNQSAANTKYDAIETNI